MPFDDPDYKWLLALIILALFSCAIALIMSLL